VCSSPAQPGLPGKNRTLPVHTCPPFLEHAYSVICESLVDQKVVVSDRCRRLQVIPSSIANASPGRKSATHAVIAVNRKMPEFRWR
jgi:hypothetical protein